MRGMLLEAQLPGERSWLMIRRVGESGGEGRKVRGPERSDRKMSMAGEAFTTFGGGGALVGCVPMMEGGMVGMMIDGGGMAVSGVGCVQAAMVDLV